MFSNKEKQQLYNLIKTYENYENYKFIGDNFVMTKHRELNWEIKSFLNFIYHKNYVSKDLYDRLKEKCRSDTYIYYENIIMEELREKFYLFDVWYVDYVSEKTLDFEYFYNGLKSAILSDIIASNDTFEEYMNKYVSDFKSELNLDNIDRHLINGIILEDKDFESIVECLDIFDELIPEEDKFEKSLIDKMRKLLKIEKE